MFDIVCVGVIVADTLAKTVDKMPESGTLMPIGSIELFTGGCALNSAIDMAKLGMNTAIIGKIGGDGFGTFIKSELQKYKINDEGLAIDAETPTSASVVLSASSGERSFIHCFGANAVFCEEDIDYKIIENSNIVFLAGFNLMTTFDGKQAAKFLEKVKKMGKTTVLDTAWDPSGEWMNKLKPCMPYIDWFLPSKEEAELLSGETEYIKIHDKFKSLGAKNIVIKLGKEGCFYVDNGYNAVIVPTFDIIKPIDTNGAGDSFCAGFLTAMTKGKNLHDCCVFANAVGTYCVSKMGASTGVADFETTMKFIETGIFN